MWVVVAGPPTTHDKRQLHGAPLCVSVQNRVSPYSRQCRPGTAGLSLIHYRTVLASRWILVEQEIAGMLIEDSSNVLVEAQLDDGDFQGSIAVPAGGDQSANLVVAGTSSGVVLKNIRVHEGAGAESVGEVLSVHLQFVRVALGWRAVFCCAYSGVVSQLSTCLLRVYNNPRYIRCGRPRSRFCTNGQTVALRPQTGDVVNIGGKAPPVGRRSAYFPQRCF